MNKSPKLHGSQVKGIQNKQTLKRSKRRFNQWDNTFVKKLNIELIHTCSWGKQIKLIPDMRKNTMKQTQKRVEKSRWWKVKIRMLTQGGYWQPARVTCYELESRPEEEKIQGCTPSLLMQDKPDLAPVMQMECIQFFWGHTKIHSQSHITLSHSPNVKNTVINVWVPQPNMTDNNIPFFGGRKTSPWTNFQRNVFWQRTTDSIWL